MEAQMTEQHDMLKNGMALAGYRSRNQESLVLHDLNIVLFLQEAHRY
jgi:hypothetical protein